MRYFLAVTIISILQLSASCLEVSQEDDPVFGTYTFSYTKDGVQKRDRYKIDYKTAEATEDGYSIYDGQSVDDSGVSITLFWTDDLSQVIFFLGKAAHMWAKHPQERTGHTWPIFLTKTDDGSFTGCAYRIPSSITSIPKCDSLDSNSGKAFAF